MLYISHFLLIYFINSSLYLLILYTYLTPPLFPLTAGNHYIFFLYLWVYFCFAIYICFTSLWKLLCFISLDSTYKWHYIVFFSIWYISLDIIISRSIRVLQITNYSFYGWVIVHCTTSLSICLLMDICVAEKHKFIHLCWQIFVLHIIDYCK